MATPATFPVPMRDARPMAKAWNDEMPWSLSREDSAAEIIFGKCRICTAHVRTVNHRPAPTSRKMRRLP